MSHGGKRVGSGRKKGAATQRTRAVADRALEEGLTPLEYMLRVMRDPEETAARRDDMAKAAARFVHPTLAAIAPKPIGDETVAPLAERIRAYERRDAIEASEGRVVELPKKDRTAG